MNTGVETGPSSSWAEPEIQFVRWETDTSRTLAVMCVPVFFSFFLFAQYISFFSPFKLSASLIFHGHMTRILSLAKLRKSPTTSSPLSANTVSLAFNMQNLFEISKWGLKEFKRFYLKIHFFDIFENGLHLVTRQK